MFKAIRRKWAVLLATAAAGGVVLCCGCSDNGIGGAFEYRKFVNAGFEDNNCGTDGSADLCKTKRIGNQIWMAENLNYETGNSWCYDNSAVACKMYGRLYDWETAKKACPSGWHLPTRAEWDTLVNYVGSSAGKALKSKSGWYDNGNGTDASGFSALPGGYRYSDGGFDGAGYGGFWWAATENGSGLAYYRYMGYGIDYNVREYGDDKSYGYSVRCVQTD